MDYSPLGVARINHIDFISLYWLWSKIRIHFLVLFTELQSILWDKEWRPTTPNKGISICHGQIFRNILIKAHTILQYRWGHTPYDDAVQFGHDHVATYIENFQSKTSCLRKEETKNTSEKSSSGYSSKSGSPGPENDKW